MGNITYIGDIVEQGGCAVAGLDVHKHSIKVAVLRPPESRLPGEDRAETPTSRMSPMKPCSMENMPSPSPAEMECPPRHQDLHERTTFMAGLAASDRYSFMSAMIRWETKGMTKEPVSMAMKQRRVP